NCGDNCDNYAGWIAKASNKEDILDSKLLLAIMMQESNCGADEHSGSSIGLMQINLIHCGKYGLTKNKGECENELLSDPELNIGLGAKILKINYNSHSGGKQFSKACTDEFKKKYYSGWKAALRGYNGWGCNPDYPKQDNYVEYVTNLHERLKEISGEEATVDPDKIIVSGNDFKVECLLTQDNERGKKAEAKNWLKCISRSESILYYDDGRLKEGTIKISTGSNNKGRRVS
ncbi:hypothetical protein CMI44_02490, partial [Candidatus Pacearchaeota archaeon]|nr:hypothetical protein [Candidatus Pacearchaeota archaeon]